MQPTIKVMIAFFVVAVLAVVGYNHHSVKKSEEQRAQMQAKIDTAKADLERREREKQSEIISKSTGAVPAQSTAQATQPAEQTVSVMPATDVEIKAVNTDEVEKAYQIEQLELLYSKWQDGDNLAQSTARIALANPVKNLQDIKREVQSLKVHSCLMPHQNSLVAGMNEIINGYYQFMQGEGEMAGALAFFGKAERRATFKGV